MRRNRPVGRPSVWHRPIVDFVDKRGSARALEIGCRQSTLLDCPKVGELPVIENKKKLSNRFGLFDSTGILKIEVKHGIDIT